MPDFSTDMSTQQKGYSAVGEFIFFFAGMESELDRLLRSLLNLRLLEGSIITSNIDISTKVYIVRSAVSMIPMNDKETLQSARNDSISVGKVAEKRNILAHNGFSPTEDGVEFFYFKAKGKVSLPEEKWTYDDFDQHIAEMIRLSRALSELNKSLPDHPAKKLAGNLMDIINHSDPGLRPGLAQLIALGTQNSINDGGSQ